MFSVYLLWRNGTTKCEMCDGMQTQLFFLLSFASLFQFLCLRICCVWTVLFQHSECVFFPVAVLHFYFSPFVLKFRFIFISRHTNKLTNKWTGEQRKKVFRLPKLLGCLNETASCSNVIPQLVAWQHENEVLEYEEKNCCRTFVGAVLLRASYWVLEPLDHTAEEAKKNRT